MTAPTPGPSPSPTPTTNPLHQAIDWTRQQANNLFHALSSINISKPAAEVATVAEAVFDAALPAALAAEEQSLAALLAPAHYQALATLVGEINATVVKQFLARIPSNSKPATTPARPLTPTA